MRRQSVGRASGLAMTHGHRDFTVCSCSLLPVLLPGESSADKCSTNADVSGGRSMRSAFVKARRRIASCTHRGTGCNQAPRPGRLVAVSMVTAYSPFPVGTATTRSNSVANSRFRHPTHVRTGPPMRLCAEAEGSRWITAQSSVTEPMVRTTRGWAVTCGPDCARRRRKRAFRKPDARRLYRVSGHAPSGGWHRVPAGPRNARANRRGCRCAIR
jgi:hypothetical protein